MQTFVSQTKGALSRQPDMKPHAHLDPEAVARRRPA
jgi:hypothetical protein